MTRPKHMVNTDISASTVMSNGSGAVAGEFELDVDETGVLCEELCS